MISAKEIKKTVKGNTYVIYQDSPSTFHVSVSIGNFVSYDFLESPSSIEAIHECIHRLESELEERVNTTLTNGFQESVNLE
jgi:hypothetical protein